jgi:RNA 2',3'-cyclic 3'-phosphodiesterase
MKNTQAKKPGCLHTFGLILMKKIGKLNKNMRKGRMMMSDKTHYFLAVSLPNHVKQSLKSAKEDVQEVFQFHRWVHPEDYHITLAFLGFANENQLRDTKQFVPQMIQNEKPFSLTISKMGTFGMKESPRIFWAGLNESVELQTLRRQVYSACEKAGFQLEKRAFHPHITLARKWQGNDAFHIGWLDIHNSFREKPIHFQADEVVLYRTNLMQTPKYEKVFTFSLQP